MSKSIISVLSKTRRVLRVTEFRRCISTSTRPIDPTGNCQGTGVHHDNDAENANNQIKNAAESTGSYSFVV